jgi:hypothetical protein
MKKLILSCAVIGFLFSACSDNPNSLKESIISAEDNALVETQLSSVFEMLDDVASSDPKMKKTAGTILPSGANLIYTDSLFTDGDGLEFHIDFGPKGHLAPFGLLCQDGRYRAGILKATLSAPYTSIGAILSLTVLDLDSFYSGNGTDMYQIVGNSVFTRTELNKLTIAMTGMKVKDGASTVTWSSNKEIVRTFDAGPGVWKDHFEITGNGNGTNRNGEAYTVTIDKPLLKKIETGCAKTFVSGIITLEVTSTGKKIIVNYDPYGNGVCDDLAEANIGGNKTLFRVK